MQTAESQIVIDQEIPQPTFPAISIFLCVFISGICGLSYQILCQSLFSALMGGDAMAAALVLAIFLGGLAIGNEIGGRLSLRADRANMLAVAGYCEMFIGAWFLMLAAMLSLLPTISIFLIQSMPGRSSADILVAVFLVLPPTIAMGAVIPLLSEVLAYQKPAGKTHALLYALNTIGSVIGCLLCGLFLLPEQGIRIPLTLFALASFALALIFKSLSGKVGVRNSILTIRQFVKLPVLFCVTAFVAGASTFAAEVITLRLFGWATGSSHYLFSLIVASFIFLSSIAAFLLRTIISGESTHIRQMRFLKFATVVCVFCCVATLLYAADLPYLMHRLRIIFPDSNNGWILYQLSTFALVTVICSPIIIPISATVPLLVNKFSSSETVGFVAGRLWKWNACGCMIGALGAGYFWFSFGSLQTLMAVSFTAVIFSMLALLAIISENRRIFLFLPVSLLLFILPQWDALRTSVGLFDLRKAEPQSYSGAAALYAPFLEGGKSLAARDDRQARVGVVEFNSASGSGSERVLYLDGKADGNTRGDAFTMKAMGHLLALFAGNNSSNAAVIGYGTGMTVGSLSLYPEIRQVDVLEISQAVKDFAPYFDSANHDLSKSSKVNWVMGDAYRSLLQTKKKYALIAAQPSIPWLSGSDRLYTLEFFEAVKAALFEDGLYTHWIPLYDTSPETVRLALHTISQVFPSVRTFQFGNDLIVLASPKKDQDNLLTKIEQRINLPQVAAELEEINLNSLSLILSHESWLPTDFSEIKMGNSLYHNRLGYMAAKDFYFGRDMDSSELMQTRDDLQKQVTASSQSLLVQAINAGQIEKNWNKLLRQACGYAKLELREPTWRLVRSPCRDSIVKAMIEGTIAVPTAAMAVIARGRLWGLQNPFNGNYSIERVRADIETFLQLYSGMNPMSEEPLIKEALWCRSLNSAEGEQCVTQILGAFQYFGLSSAQTKLNQMLANGEP